MERKPLPIFKYFNKTLFALAVSFVLVNVTAFARTIILAESEVIEASSLNLDVVKTPSAKKKSSKKHYSINKNKMVKKTALITTNNKKISNIKIITKKTKCYVEKNYSPYIQISGMALFNEKENSKAAQGIDFYIPLWQEPDNLIFSDIRFFDGSGKPFEGNFQIGYRHLSPLNETLYGVYGSFDCKKTQHGNYFTQLAVGAEFWSGGWFIGGNIYAPIGETKKDLNHVEDDGYWITTDKRHEEALPGIDAEVGYEFTTNLTGYIGGYYFVGRDVGSKAGPKARLIYSWSRYNNKRLLGIFDRIELEGGAQSDKLEHTRGYLGFNFRIGGPGNKNETLTGVSHHMVDPIRRDANIVTMSQTTRQRQLKQHAFLINKAKEENLQRKSESLSKANRPPAVVGEEKPALADNRTAKSEPNSNEESQSVGSKIPTENPPAESSESTSFPWFYFNLI